MLLSVTAASSSICKASKFNFLNPSLSHFLLPFSSINMAASIRKNLTFSIFKHASNKNVRFSTSPASLSISFHFFSTQTPTHLDSSPNPTVYDTIVHKHKFPRSFASCVSKELSFVKNPENVDSMLTFLKSSGFSNAQLQKILKYRPRYLCYSVEDIIKPKIKGFQDEGFSSRDICKIISSDPAILQLSLNNNIIPSLSVIKGLLGSDSAATKVVRKYPRLLQSNLERTVVANVEVLETCGLSLHRIQMLLNEYPGVFCRKPDIVREYIEKAKEMGLTADSKAFIYAIRTIASMSNESWELKLQAFRDVGFAETEIWSMFRKEPRAFCVSAEKMKKVTEGLVAVGRFGISDIVECPISLLYNFEKRIEARMRLLKTLESRNLTEDWPTFGTLCILPDAKFLERFVSPYLDQLSDVCIPKLSAINKVKRKP